MTYKSQIRTCFQSRWKEGYLLEVDFSQIEVVALAIISGDKQLEQDLLSGVDMHLKSVASILGVEYNVVKEMYDLHAADIIQLRKRAKVWSFQLQYGAGPKKMAETFGVSTKEAKEFIQAYYRNYPEVEAYHQHMLNLAKQNRQPSTYRTKNNFPAGVYYHKSITGRVYCFVETDNPFATDSGMGNVNFSPTQLKNYPIQGFATADIVPLMVGLTVQELIDRDSPCLYINTVHDSMLFDCPALDKAREAAGIIRGVLANTDLFVRSLWAIQTPLQFKFDCTIGKSWGNMYEYRI